MLFSDQNIFFLYRQLNNCFSSQLSSCNLYVCNHRRYKSDTLVKAILLLVSFVVSIGRVGFVQSLLLVLAQCVWLASAYYTCNTVTLVPASYLCFHSTNIVHQMVWTESTVAFSTLLTIALRYHRFFQFFIFHTV